MNQSVGIMSHPTFSGVYTQYINTNSNDLTVYTGTDKTVLLNHPVYNDINIDINPRNTGVGRPTLATFKGNIQQYRFAVGDFSDFRACEIPHSWKEGTQIEFHVHWSLGTANDANLRGVKFEIEYTYADMAGVFSANDTQSAESSVALNEPAYTHKYTSIFSFSPATKVGTQMCVRLKRISSVINANAPNSDPFIISFGIHYQSDTIGSRLISTK